MYDNKYHQTVHLYTVLICGISDFVFCIWCPLQAQHSGWETNSDINSTTNWLCYGECMVLLYFWQCKHLWQVITATTATACTCSGCCNGGAQSSHFAFPDWFQYDWFQYDWMISVWLICYYSMSIKWSLCKLGIVWHVHIPHSMIVNHYHESYYSLIHY